MDLILKVVLVSALSAQFVTPAVRVKRLSLAEPITDRFYQNNAQDGTYSFNYDVSDIATGNNQYRTEARDENGTVTGSYGFIDAFGFPQQYRYVADKKGYRVLKENRFFNPFALYPTPTAQIPMDFVPSHTVDYVPSYSVDPEITWTRPNKPLKKQSAITIETDYNLNDPPMPFVPYIRPY